MRLFIHFLVLQRSVDDILIICIHFISKIKEHIIFSSTQRKCFNDLYLTENSRTYRCITTSKSTYPVTGDLQTDSQVQELAYF